jgi:hypothetical protein
MMRLEPRSDPSNVMIGLTPIFAGSSNYDFWWLTFCFSRQKSF